MLSCLKLPLTFDPVGLQADLQQINDDEWVRHFNDRYFEGDWSGVALLSVNGASKQLYSDPTEDESPTDTPVLARCPSMKETLAAFKCRVKSARLLKLGAGSRIIEHRDYNLSLEDEDARLHVTITTSELIDFHVNGERIVMNPGECWYINANLPHSVTNRSDKARVHLVIDCKVDDWLRSLAFSAAVKSNVHQGPLADDKPRPSSPEALKLFCDVVFQDKELQQKLKQIIDRELFIDLVVRCGEERGFYFAARDVDDVLRDNRRAWIERWV